MSGDKTFRKKLEGLLNEHNREGQSDTPDFILAKYLHGCLNVFDHAVRSREAWYGRGHKLTADDKTVEPPSGDKGT